MRQIFLCLPWLNAILTNPHSVHVIFDHDELPNRRMNYHLQRLIKLINFKCSCSTLPETFLSEGCMNMRVPRPLRRNDICGFHRTSPFLSSLPSGPDSERDRKQHMTRMSIDVLGVTMSVYLPTFFSNCISFVVLFILRSRTVNW